MSECMSGCMLIKEFVGGKVCKWHVVPGLGLSKSRCMLKTEHVGGKVLNGMWCWDQ